ncbi:hypothetical protein, partial [Elioraea sp.]|uniref:hypothetical protein n=1 Tax=Elioraea sp. TaxID=2185103 RepID=UPI003F722837
MTTRISTSLVVLLAAQAVQTTTTLLAAPVLVHGLGLDGFGLLGITTMLLLLLGVLDAGASTALTRRLAAEGTAPGAALLAAAERVLLASALAVALLGAVLAWPLAGVLASAWPRAELAGGLALATLSAAAFWPTGLYQAGLNGRGRQVEAALIQAAGAMLRWGGAVVLVLGGLTDVRAVLLWQALAGAGTAAVLRARLRRGLPPARASLVGATAYVRDVSALALLGTGFMLIDRLAGAAILTLGAFGAYALVAQVAQMLGVLTMPVRAVWFPRVAAAVTNGQEGEARRALDHAAQVLAILIMPSAAVFVLLPRALLWSWTGSSELVAHAATALAGLAAGWALMGLASTALIRDFARGTMRRATVLSASAVSALVVIAPSGAV